MAKVDKQKTIVDIAGVCKYYKKKYGIDMQYQSNKKRSEGNKISPKNKENGVIYQRTDQKQENKGHHYGVVFIKYKDTQYYIVINTCLGGGDFVFVKDIQKTQETQKTETIYFGEWLQTDRNNCSIFTLNIMKTLLKNNGEIAKLLIDFYEINKKNYDHRYVNVSIYQIYRKIEKSFPDLQKKFPELESVKDLFDIEEDGVLIRVKEMYYEAVIEKVSNITDLLDYKFEDLSKGPFILYGGKSDVVKNDDFFTWEHAPEILKLAQSKTLQKKVFDKNVGKYKTKMENYFDFYSKEGGQVEDVENQEELGDKIISTKVYVKKRKYKNINSEGELNELQYKEEAKKLVNPEANVCEELKNKFNASKLSQSKTSQQKGPDEKVCKVKECKQEKDVKNEKLNDKKNVLNENKESNYENVLNKSKESKDKKIDVKGNTNKSQSCKLLGWLSCITKCCCINKCDCCLTSETNNELNFDKIK